MERAAALHPEIQGRLHRVLQEGEEVRPFAFYLLVGWGVSDAPLVLFICLFLYLQAGCCCCDTSLSVISSG